MGEKYLEILEDKIFVGDSVDDLAAEIDNNMWLISMSEEEKLQLSFEELKEFYSMLITNRSQQVQDAANRGMIFYTRFDEHASQLYFD